MSGLQARRARKGAFLKSQFLRLAGFLVLLSFAALSMACGGGSTATNNPPSSPAGSGSSGSGSSGSNPTQRHQCPAVTLAEDQGPTTGVAPMPAPGPVPPPNPGSTANGSVCVTQPANNATVASPFTVTASTTLVNPIYHMRVYVDGMPEYFTFYNQFNALIWAGVGSHNLEVIATDTQGNDVSTTFTVNVANPPTTSVTGLQNMMGWQPCSALFPPGDPRAGQICAAGLGEAMSTMTEDQASPSLSGSSAKFTMGGSHPYSNELYTLFLGGGSNPTQFTYDLDFYVDMPDRPQALEFDVNQSFNGQRWVYGTECNFKADGKWDVWDGVQGWQATDVPCRPFSPNSWNHLTWQFERVGNQVHYISVTVNGHAYPLDLYKSNEPHWPMENITVAFQMDGDYAQQPYNVWLDNVTLTVQ